MLWYFQISGAGLLSKPLQDTKVPARLKPLWDYLESACYVRQWSPGKTFIAFNITSSSSSSSTSSSSLSSPSTSVFGSFSGVSAERLDHISLNRQRQIIPYDASAHSHRAVFFPGLPLHHTTTHHTTSHHITLHHAHHLESHSSSHMVSLHPVSLPSLSSPLLSPLFPNSTRSRPEPLAHSVVRLLLLRRA